MLEGVNALGAAPDRLDVGVYLDAAEADLEHWYVTRFLDARRGGARRPVLVLCVDAALSDDEVEQVARSTWAGINLVNLREHIAVTRAFADLVVVKGPDHRIVEVRERPPPPP